MIDTAYRGQRHWRALAACLVDPDNAGLALRTLAAGFSAGLFAWESSHLPLLENFLLTNQVADPERQALLRWAALGVAGWLAAWLACVLVLAGLRRGDARAVLRRSANLLFLAVFLPFLPILALQGFAARNPTLDLCLVSGLAALAVFSGQQLAQDWAVPRRQAGGRQTGVARTLAPGLIAVVILALGYTIYFSLLTIAKHNAFGTHSFDLGIFDQGLYTILHHGIMLSTQHGLETIKHFGRHFSPILYFLAPVYALKQDARTLLAIQSLFLGAGAIPVYLLARQKTGSQWAGLLFGASYLLYPALHGVNNFDFSEIALVPPLLLFCLYFLETGRDRWFACFLALALMTKEEVALSGVAIGLYIFLAKRRPGLAAIVTGGSLAYFVLVNLVLMPALGHGPLVDVFASVMPTGDIGFGGLIKSLFTNPVYIFKFIFFNPDKVSYLWQLMLPVLFLPLLSWRVGYILLPALAVPLLSRFPAHYQIGYQYPATSIAFVFFLAILAVGDLQQKRPYQAARWHAGGLSAAVLVVSLVMNYQGGWLFSQQFTGFATPTAHQQVLASFVSQVPRAASVSSMSDIVPHLSSRDRVYLFPIVNHADYLLLDMDLGANYWPYLERDARYQVQKIAAPYFLSGEYGVVRTEDNCILLQRGYSTARNPEGLQVLFAGQRRAADLRSDFAVHDVADAQAQGTMARVGQPGLEHAKDKNALTYGPYDTLMPGKYRITYRLKLAGQPQPGAVATLDIFSNAAGGALAGRTLSASDFKTPGAYEEFGVDLEVRQAFPDIEYRVLYTGRSNLWVDTIRVTPLRLALPETGQTVDLGQ